MTMEKKIKIGLIGLIIGIILFGGWWIFNNQDSLKDTEISCVRWGGRCIEKCGICELPSFGGNGGCPEMLFCCSPTINCKKEACNSAIECGKSSFCEDRFGRSVKGSTCYEYNYVCENNLCKVKTVNSFSTSELDNTYYNCDEATEKCELKNRYLCSTDAECDAIYPHGKCEDGFCEFGMSEPPECEK